MEPLKSIEIIEHILNESKKSLHRNSFYFILWGSVLSLAALLDYAIPHQLHWLAWPIASVIGGIISMIYGRKESKRSGSKTGVDRITSYTWGAFGFTLIFVLVYSISNQMSPSPLILMLAGSATFISGGISKFNPLIAGGIVLEIGAVLCAFMVSPHFHPIIFAIGIILGYVVPGLMLRKSEND
jgi:hypothetical protein